MDWKDKLGVLRLHILELLEEASTWRSLVFFVAMLLGKSEALGKIPDEQLLMMCTSAAYLVGLFFKDKLK